MQELSKESETRESKVDANPATSAIESDLRVFEKWLDGRGFNKQEIQDFLKWATENRSPSTVARYKASIKAHIRKSQGFALTRGADYLLDDFFREIKTPKAETKINETKVLSSEERRAIRKASGQKTKMLVQALYESGARVSEIINLKISDCETIRGITYCDVLGKGKKRRTVYLKARTYQKIRRLYASKVYLFESQPGKAISRFTAHTLLSRAGRRIGRRLHPHMLRHSRATDLLNKGEALSSVAAYLGHSSPEITARFYLHGLPKASRIMQGID